MRLPHAGPVSRAWTRCLGVAACGLALAASLSAQAPLEIERGRPLLGHAARRPGANRAGRLDVNTKGGVTVRGADGEAVRYVLQMRLPASGDEAWARGLFRVSGVVPVRSPDGSLQLVLQEPRCANCQFEARLEIQVPMSLPVIEVLTRAGSVDMRDVSGSVQARTRGGSIHMDGIRGPVTATTAGGSIYLGTVGGSVDCSTSGGSIHLRRATGSARLKTTGGSIRVTRVEGDLDAETGGGSIRVTRVEGDLDAETGGGGIQVERADGTVRATTGAGDVRIGQAMGPLTVSSGVGDIVAAFQSGAVLRDSILETSVGSIVVSLPESLALTVDASVRMARGLRGITSEFPRSGCIGRGRASALSA